jgi:hypothetical protein
MSITDPHGTTPGWFYVDSHLAVERDAAERLLSIIALPVASLIAQSVKKVR